MTSFEDIKKYLPQYLSDSDAKQLFSALKDFPNNIDSRFYNSYNLDDNILYQGDCLKDIPAFNLPDIRTKLSQSMTISNTCDMDLNNKRLWNTRILFSQIILLEKLEKALYQKFSEDRISNYISSLKKQQITNAFYLPKSKNLDEAIVFFDYTNSFDINFVDRESLKEKRLVSLSNYGFYILLLKLSIHFTRIQEKVQRN
ncbi:hypothetical protein [Capnocytophaga leadbetteri]|uniref:hypothetical protein n=1 Tax=Capnocytophaga leadbetteri TaxID=327575 RepID=UPI0028E25678|nr:hypothetical protein [Capnocytophaga leadbetteri]